MNKRDALLSPDGVNATLTVEAAIKKMALMATPLSKSQQSLGRTI